MIRKVIAGANGTSIMHSPRFFLTILITVERMAPSMLPRILMAFAVVLLPGTSATASAQFSELPPRR